MAVQEDDRLHCSIAAGGTGCNDTTDTALVTAGQSVVITNAGTAGANDFKAGVVWTTVIK